MYVHKHFVYEDGHKYGPYWDVVRGVRVGKKVHHEYVGTVGRADTKAEAYARARALGLLCGAPCNRAPEVDVLVEAGPARVCREHLEELRRAELGDPRGHSIIVPLECGSAPPASPMATISRRQ
jgi:hypothetical protein